MLTEEQFTEIRAYADYPAYQADHRPLRETTTEVLVTDAEIVTAVRSTLTVEENARFDDEQVRSKSEYYRGGNTLKSTVADTVADCRRAIVDQDRSIAENEAAREVEGGR